MKLELRRVEAHLGFTIGALYIDGHFFCWTLEDQIRPPGVKIPGETCIPAGTYRVVIDWSERYQKPMPHVLDVPMFTGIRIHPGNCAADTAGCILVGANRDKPGICRVYNSLAAFDALFHRMQMALGEGQVIDLVVTNEFGAA